jgi:mono/diheme cytochrome c family protein
MAKFPALCVAMIFTASMAAAQGQRAPNQSKLIARGKYLVANVAMCGDCHSPHDQQGREVSGRELQGAPLFFQPVQPVPGWVPVAPPIAGLEGWTKSEAVRFLMTGIKRDGKPAAPPMPPVRLSRNDAEAVVAYLKSLKPLR